MPELPHPSAATTPFAIGDEIKELGDIEAHVDDRLMGEPLPPFVDCRVRCRSFHILIAAARFGAAGAPLPQLGAAVGRASGRRGRLVHVRRKRRQCAFGSERGSTTRVSWASAGGRLGVPRRPSLLRLP